MNTYSNKGKIRQLCNVALEMYTLNNTKLLGSLLYRIVQKFQENTEVVENVIKLSSENQY